MNEFWELIEQFITVPHTREEGLFFAGPVSMIVESAYPENPGAGVYFTIVFSDEGINFTNTIQQKNRRTIDVNEMTARKAASFFDSIVNNAWELIFQTPVLEQTVKQAYAHRCLARVSGKEEFLRLTSSILRATASYEKKKELISMAFYAAAIQHKCEEEMHRLMMSLELTA